jgi:formate dehydrogenase subunit gamma
VRNVRSKTGFYYTPSGGNVTTSSWDIEVAKERIEALKDLPGAALPILNALQAEFGYVDDAAIPLIADALNLSRAEVVGVVHFYSDYRHEPPGRHIVKVCRAEACQSMGCDALVGHVEASLGAAMGETTANGTFTLEDVYCLGNCALSPAVMIDGRLYGRVSASKFDALVAQVEAAE